MILLDWTRMGKCYCLAGAVEQGDHYRVVRPLLLPKQVPTVRNVGWPTYLLDGHARWEIFEVVGAMPAPPQPPHLEDVWVHSLRSRRRVATPAQRRAILEQTSVQTAEALFGTPLKTTAATAYATPGEGLRSLATLKVPTRSACFQVSRRHGASEPDYRVVLSVAELGERHLPVTDHHLLCRAEGLTSDLAGRANLLNLAVQQMGTHLAVRLGLSRAFATGSRPSAAVCWLMADGFFSWTEPQS
jgi:hypothetical protein